MGTKRHRLIPKVLSTSSSFQRDLSELFKLSVEQIEKVARLAETEYGFDLPDESLKDAAGTLRIDFQRLSRILAVVDFLYDHARVGNINKEDASRQVCEFANNLDIKDCETKISAIQHLFEPKIAYDRRKMIGSFQSAVVPTLAGVITACDIRAVVDRRTGEIAGYVPMVLLGMQLKDSDGDGRKIDVQVNEANIDELLEELRRVKGLLAILKTEFKAKIINIIEEDTE